MTNILPTNKIRARKPKPEIYPLLLEKLSKFVIRDYFSFLPSSQVTSCIDLFQVTNGSDIRHVFNVTSSGLNEAV